MTVNDKRIPFIAKRLGVEVDEKFKIVEMAKLRDSNGLNVVFMIRDDGTYTTIPENAQNSSIAILKAIDDPEHQVIKCLKITEKEKEDLKMLFKIWPDLNATICIDKNEAIEIDSPEFKYYDYFYSSLLFPSLTKNKTYNLYSLISGSAENA